jgi:high-affinity iron transporter
MFQAFTQAFVITLREGLEAFLIVAISLTYLRKTGRARLALAVQWGVAVALAISVLCGFLLYNAANQERFEGPLALLAAASVSWMIVHMWRTGRRMKGDIEGHLQSSSVASGWTAFFGVFSFTLLMVTREGMESALLLIQVRQTMDLLLGGALGLVGAAAMAWLWTRYGHHVNLGLFFQVTAIFLFVFVVQLLIAGFHETAEQNFLPYSTAIHEATESWGPDSAFGHMLTYMLAILPLSWLAIRTTLLRRPERTPSASTT